MVDPEVRYARSGDLHIAYEVVGDGAIDVVHVPGFLYSLEAARDGAIAAFRTRLGRVARLVQFDKRGTGLSDRLPGGDPPTIEERIDDIRAVMDAVGIERAALLGVADGGPVAMFFAATHPERTSALALSATGARITWAPDYPWGLPAEVVEAHLESIATNWGTGMMSPFFAATDDRQAMARIERLAGTPSSVAAVYRMNCATDVRDVLPTIAAPTLIVHNVDHPIWPIEGARYLAEHIPGARLVEVPGRPTGMTASTFVAQAEEFFTGQPPVVEFDRVLRTVLFTDIIGSTEQAAAMGDSRWRELLDAHDDVVQRQLDAFRGTQVKTTGDGVLAAFDGPARAIRCARALTGDVRQLGLEIRAGIHTGECELRGDDLAGIAVHIGARVAALAGPGEILVTSTVRDLVAGSGIEFGDRGPHELRGVPGEWRVLAVRG